MAGVVVGGGAKVSSQWLWQRVSGVRRRNAKGRANIGFRSESRDDVFHHGRLLDAEDSETNPLHAVREALVSNARQVHHRGVEVAPVDGIRCPVRMLSGSMSFRAAAPHTIYTVGLPESQSCKESGMGILPMNHGRDARGTSSVHAIGL